MAASLNGVPGRDVSGLLVPGRAFIAAGGGSLPLVLTAGVNVVVPSAAAATGVFDAMPGSMSPGLMEPGTPFAAAVPAAVLLLTGSITP